MVAIGWWGRDGEFFLHDNLISRNGPVNWTIWRYSFIFWGDTLSFLFTLIYHQPLTLWTPIFNMSLLKHILKCLKSCLRIGPPELPMWKIVVVIIGSKWYLNINFFNVKHFFLLFQNLTSVLFKFQISKLLNVSHTLVNHLDLVPVWLLMWGSLYLHYIVVDTTSPHRRIRQDLHVIERNRGPSIQERASRSGTPSGSFE